VAVRQRPIGTGGADTPAQRLIFLQGFAKTPARRPGFFVCAFAAND
jgi:hypothetical protein